MQIKQKAVNSWMLGSISREDLKHFGTWKPATHKHVKQGVEIICLKHTAGSNWIFFHVEGAHCRIPWWF